MSSPLRFDLFALIHRNWNIFSCKSIELFISKILSAELVIVGTCLRKLFASSALTVSMIENIPDFRQEYLSHSEINEYLCSLQTKYPHLARVENIGHSFEKREIKSIHLSASIESNTPGNGAIYQNLESTKSSDSIHRKPVILIDAGMHAREWCTISTALHCVSELTENFDKNHSLLDAFEFVIVPVVNVDGYEYSRTIVRSTFCSCSIIKIFSNFILFWKFIFLFAEKKLAKITSSDCSFQIRWCRF